MEFISLASSSRGNAYIADDGETRLLIECGIGFKKLLTLTGHEVSRIDGCILSHEHKDHAKCAGEMILSGIPLYTSEGTAEAAGLSGAVCVYEREMFSVGTMDVIPFPVFHDAAEPFGYFIRSRVTGKRLMFATDTARVNFEFSRLNIIALECNYMRDVLDMALRLHDKVRHRIINSHMEAGEALKFIRTLDLSRLEKIYLMHLSDACSDERRIRKMFEDALDAEIVICEK